MGKKDKISLRAKRLRLRWSLFFWRQARKFVVGITGGTVIIAGIAMLLLPGPGWLTIFAGLGILATEFAWAGWVLKVAKERLAAAMEKVQQAMPRNGKTETAPTPPQSCPPRPNPTS